ncbi:MAG: HAD family phosphatase [Candidatus Levybacteria bacterium]|nr:HAD family phosphatase [Candidatus Levybacteria bacterium]
METIKPVPVEIAKENKGILKVKETLKNGGWAFFDVDGTLEDTNGIPIDLNTYLQLLISNGVELGISTGRCQTDLIRFFSKVGDSYRQLFKGWLFLEDSHVTVEPGNSINEAAILTDPKTLQEMEMFEKLFTSSWLPSEALPGWGFLKNLPAPPVKLPQYPHYGTVAIWEKGPYESPEYGLMMVWALNAARQLGIETIEFLETGDGSLRLLQKGINKGTGLKTLVERGIIDLSRTVYFGDANNDISAAEIVSNGGGAVVALANATRGFKNVSTHVTSHPAGLGVIEVVKQLY